MSCATEGFSAITRVLVIFLWVDLACHGASTIRFSRAHAHACVCIFKLTEFPHAPPHRSARRSHRSPGRRIQARRSGVHGKGVFAVQDIAEGEVVIEYTGEVISWQEAQDRHPHDPAQPNHTFYFHVDEDRVIDAKFGGNSARWINHSCDPNCFADEQDGRIFITALRNIRAGEELNYDYGLIIEERYTPKLKAEYPCWCGSENCRGTLLAPKRGWRPPLPGPKGGRA